MPASSKVKSYCVSCKAKQIMVRATRVSLKNGRDAMEGTCKKCGTKMFKFVKK
jgi:RNase P subunit RPR2